MSRFLLVESRQQCEKNGQQYRYGQQAALALSDKIGRSTIQCDERNIDRYKWIVARLPSRHGRPQRPDGAPGRLSDTDLRIANATD